MNDSTGLVQIIEAALLAAGKPLGVTQLAALFEEHERPAKEDILAALEDVRERCAGRGYELVEIASGYRFQVREQMSPWVSRLWQERPQKYSRALLETLALVAYRQPITRGEIEEIRGVAVSTNIIRTLHEREWIRVVGHRDVPGRPSMYATTRDFLDYFSLKSLDQLPALADIRDLETLNAELGFSEPLPESANSDTSSEQAKDDPVLQTGGVAATAVSDTAKHSSGTGGSAAAGGDEDKSAAASGETHHGDNSGLTTAAKRSDVTQDSSDAVDSAVSEQVTHDQN